MNLFMENLDNALNDVQMPHVHCDNIEQILSKINDLKKQVSDAEEEMNRAIDKMCADIAVEIRQLNPFLKVILKNKCLDVIYKTKLLSCQVMPVERCWEFGSTEFGRVFLKRNSHCCRLDCPMSDLAAAIDTHFRNSFRSLI